MKESITIEDDSSDSEKRTERSVSRRIEKILHGPDPYLTGTNSRRFEKPPITKKKPLDVHPENKEKKVKVELNKSLNTVYVNFFYLIFRTKFQKNQIIKKLKLIL
jgi:hypothetical protein